MSIPTESSNPTPEQLFDQHKYLIDVVVAKFRADDNTWEDDMRSTGAVALWKLCQKPTPEDLTKFRTYAYICIRRRTWECFCKLKGISRTDLRMRKQRKEVELKLTEQLGRSPTLHEVFDNMEGLSPKRKQEAIERLTHKVTSIDAPLSAESNGFSLKDVVPDESPTPEQICKQNQSHETLHKVLSTLPKQEREVITMLYLQGKSSLEVAKIFGFTRQRARQCVLSGFKKLRRGLSREELIGDYSAKEHLQLMEISNPPLPDLLNPKPVPAPKPKTQQIIWKPTPHAAVLLLRHSLRQTKVLP